MELPIDVFDDWSGGVVDSLRADLLPKTVSPRGVNSTLVSVGLGKAVVGKRRGAVQVLETPIRYATGDNDLAVFTSLFQHNHQNAGQLDRYTYLTDAENSLYNVDLSDGTVDSPIPLFTAGNGKPLWAQLNNVAYVANGTEQKKVVIVSGVPTVQKHGIDAPTQATSSALSDGEFYAEAVAGGSMSAATWRVAITFVNAHTGAESNLSDFFELHVTTSQQIMVYWAATDPQVTHVRVYMLKVGTLTEFRRQEVWEFAEASSPQTFGTSTDINTTLMLTFAPEAGTNGVPSATIKGWTVHNNRLFGWDDQYIYWSDISEIGPEPESFLAEAYLPVAPNDGSPITACFEIDDNTLAIFKGASLYGLFGVDPNSWELRVIDPSLGCVAPNSITLIEGTTYFWSRLGPVAWKQGTVPRQIGYELLGETTKPEAIYYPNAPDICVAVDPPRRKVWWAFPTADSSSYNNHLVAFNYQLGVFENTFADPFDVSCMRNIVDAQERQYIYMGGYFGKFYKWWADDVDGIRLRKPQTSALNVTNTGVGELTVEFASPPVYSVGQYVQIYGFDPLDGAPHPLEGVNLQITGIVGNDMTVAFSGTYASYAGAHWIVMCFFSTQGNVVSATTNSLTVEAGTNIDDEDHLIGHYLYVYIPPLSTYQRRRISGVTGSTYTFDVATPWDTVPDTTYRWILSTPIFEWDTRWDYSEQPFHEKRYMFIYADAVCDSGETELTIDMYLNFSMGQSQKTFSFGVSGQGSTFDNSVFDSAVFDIESISRLRRRIAKISPAYRYRIRHSDPGRQLILIRLGTKAHMLTDRRSN